MEPWIVGSRPSKRYPLWTRANVGEVFPGPVLPLSFTSAMPAYVEMGWRDAMVQIGAFTPDEFDPDNMETIGVHGSYAYLNASVTRIFGERAPGMTAQMMDDQFFGVQSGITPYQPAPGDVNEERTAAIGETLKWVMSTQHLEGPAASQELVDDLRAHRPVLDEMSNQELWAHGEDLMRRHWRQFFGEHIFITYLSNIPVGAVAQFCAAVGRPEDTMQAVSGVGDVQSAEPSPAMWGLGRLVASSPPLSAEFDAGIDGLLDRLRSLGSDAQLFLDGFDDFIDRFGCRGPNEWEATADTWETLPELPLAAIDRMRLADEDADPERKQRHMAAERERVVGEISEALSDDADNQAAFQAAARAAVLFQAGRERTKTNCIKLAHERRLTLFEIGRRLVADGKADAVNDIRLLKNDEVEAWLRDPTPFRAEIAKRGQLLAEYAARREPFVFDGTQPDPSTWPLRVAESPVAVRQGEVMTGVSGCPGKVTGVARIITDPAEATTFEPGAILVAPLSDPAWTPLFVSAAGVVVDVGAAQSHAMIISRELGIPAVPSITDATLRIPDGATLTVDGDLGTVTVVSLP